MVTVGRVQTDSWRFFTLVLLLGSLAPPTLSRQTQTIVIQSNDFSITVLNAPKEAYENQTVTFTVTVHNIVQDTSTWVRVSLFVDDTYTSNTTQNLSLLATVHKLTIPWQAQQGNGSNVTRHQRHRHRRRPGLQSKQQL